MAEGDKIAEDSVHISHAPTLNVKYGGTDKPILLVDTAVVQNSVDLGMFYLSFFQNDFRIETPTEFSTTCVGRFGITPQGMATLISLLQRNLERFQRTIMEEYQQASQAKHEGPKP